MTSKISMLTLAFGLLALGAQAKAQTTTPTKPADIPPACTPGSQFSANGCVNALLEAEAKTLCQTNEGFQNACSSDEALCDKINQGQSLTFTDYGCCLSSLVQEQYPIPTGISGPLQTFCGSSLIFSTVTCTASSTVAQLGSNLCCPTSLAGSFPTACLINNGACPDSFCDDARSKKNKSKPKLTK